MHPQQLHTDHEFSRETSRLRHKCLMSRGHSSFERVFPRSGTESAPVHPSGDAPSVHELFAMALREELPLPQLAEALRRLHGIRMTVAAAAVPGQDQLCVQSKQRHIDIARLRELAAAMAQDLGFLVNVSVPTIKILQAAQASAKVMKVPGAIESQEADSADAITEWLQRLQLQLGGAFTWATEETEDLSEMILQCTECWQDGFTINGERYQIEGLLGEGSFGSVYRCLLDGQGVAVKVLSTERIAVMTNCPQHVVLRRMLQEAEILGCLGGHPNIVQLRVAAVSQQTLRIYLAMQLLECGDLFSEMLRRRRQPFSERDAREALTQVTMAVVHCHRRGVAHRDIKLENLMVAGRRPLVVKLIDFGQAVMHHDQSQQRMQSVVPRSDVSSD
eukprot:s6015_g1.t1